MTADWNVQVRNARIEAGRTELIGGGCDALIPAHPAKEAIDARRRRANESARGNEVERDHFHTIANPMKGEKPGERKLPNQGYRPKRSLQKRQQRKGGGPNS